MSRAILAYRHPVKSNPGALLPKKFFSFQYIEITWFFINFSEIALFGTHGAVDDLMSIFYGSSKKAGEFFEEKRFSLRTTNTIKGFGVGALVSLCCRYNCKEIEFYA